MRPISGSPQESVADEDLLDALEHARSFVEAVARRAGRGSTDAVLGVMPDWNPAEMIGIAPRPLAMSLYQLLIGSSAWAEARADLGYRDLRPRPLIVSVVGVPYVDVGSSLASFIPAAVDDEVADRWTRWCIQELRRRPALHDKIEFELAITCADLAWPRHAERMASAGFEPSAVERYRIELLAVTNRLVGASGATIGQGLAAITTLGARRAAILARRPADSPGLAATVQELIADCIRFGIVPFASLARHAFVGLAFLRSLREIGVFADDEVEAVLRSIPTVATELALDLARLGREELAQAELLEVYGHLRPGSYDILAPNYATAPERYLAGASHTPVLAPGDPAEVLAVFDRHGGAIDEALTAGGFAFNSTALARFVLEAVQARERSKFEFMKSVDAALETVAALGASLDLDRQTMSFLPVETLFRLATDSATSAHRSHLIRTAGFHEKLWNLTVHVRLPELISRPEDVVSFQLGAWRPNFITRERLTARAVLLDAGTSATNLDGCIVLIEAADPGFDWLFGHSIAGLVTAYGGVASHMAIRAAELGIPAAIGCGAARFAELARAAVLELDCGAQRIRRVS